MQAEAQELEPQTALITVEQINAPRLFGDGQIKEILGYIRKQVGDVVPDVSTAKGRAEIKSAAYKVARSKTLLDDAGKEYAAELKKTVANIDKNRRTLRDKLDALRDEIRKPLTDWERAEQERAEAIQNGINALIMAGQTTEGTTEALRKALEHVKATEIIAEAFGDRAGEAAIAKDVAVSNLERALKAAEKREAEAEELEHLRREQEARAEQDRVREAEERAEQRAREKADREARERVEAAERETRAAQERAEQAERRAEAERREREEKARREREADEARAADREHRRKVNRAVVAVLCEWTDITKDQAESVVTLIAAGQLSNVTIRY